MCSFNGAHALAVSKLAFVIGLSCFTLPARADYPDRPVRTVLSYGAGGVADVTMQLVANKLSERMHGQFVVENRPGPGGINAALAAKSSKPDGYTLLMNGNGSALSVSLFKSLPYDIMKDFVISVLAQFDMLLATRTESDIGTLSGLVERGRAAPGKLNFGTIASGSTQHLAAELFKSATGVEAENVGFIVMATAIMARPLE